jgi:ankyrin repeat protein
MGDGASRNSPVIEPNEEPQLSDLYLACERGDADAVKTILSTNSYNKLNRKEINGSTTLHAAVEIKNKEIFNLLLNIHDPVLRNETNQQGLTAYEEGKTNEIRLLFQRPSTNPRFCEAQNDDNNFLSFYLPPIDPNKTPQNPQHIYARLGISISSNSCKIIQFRNTQEMY